MKKEIDFSKGKRNKFAGKKLVILGAKSGLVRTYRKATARSVKAAAARKGNGHSVTRVYWVKLPARGDLISVTAANKADARIKILRKFHKTRLPNGTVIERADA